MATHTEVSGELVLIPPGIPNLVDKKEEKSLLKNLLKEKPLFNAENVTITDEGRIFVTGSLEVCEVKENEEKNGQLIVIPIGTSSIPQNYFRNGITAQGNSLYLACTHIYKRDKSFFPDLLGDIRKKDQNRYGLLLVGINKWDLGYQVDSYILRADLKNQDMKFTDEIPLPKKGKCFANGLDSDGKALYVANSYANFIHQNFFYKLLLTDDGEITEVQSIGFSSPNYDGPNGLKVRSEKDGDYLYYTCVQQFPIMTSSLKRIKMNENAGNDKQAEVKVEEAEVIYQSRFSFFDDFDIVDNGFVIADIAIIPQFSSCLHFVWNDGKLKGTFRHKNLIKPSSVKVLKNKINLFEAGDVLITEKGLHCVSWYRPDDEMRKWLIRPGSNQRR